jgi:hypothetical protein
MQIGMRGKLPSWLSLSGSAAYVLITSADYYLLNKIQRMG